MPTDSEVLRPEYSSFWAIFNRYLRLTSKDKTGSIRRRDLEVLGSLLGERVTADARGQDPESTILATFNAWQTETAVESSSSNLRQQFQTIHLEAAESGNASLWHRVFNATKALGIQIKDLVCSERVNLLLAVVPVGIAVGLLAEADPVLVFILNALAIIPLAVIISTATESLASRLGDTPGALLNVTVGNAAELIIFFTALAKDQIRIVQASLLGSVLANSLLVLGTANICGGLRFGSHLYDKATGRLSVCLLDIGISVALLPVGIYSSTHHGESNKLKPAVLALSRAISIGLIVVYLLYLLLQMIVQTIDKDRIDIATSTMLRRDLPLEEQHPISSFARFGLPFSKGSAGSLQGRSPQRFRSLSLSVPALNEHQIRSRTWMPNLGVASLFKMIRRAMFLDSNDPHDDFYVLHDISHTASSETLPELGSVEAASSERRKHNMHQLPFFPPGGSIVRADSPMSNAGDLQPRETMERAPPLTFSPPSTPDRTTPIPSHREAQSLIIDTKRARSDQASDPEGVVWPDTPSDTYVGDESGRQSPSDSEQSFKTQKPLSAAIIVLLLTTAIASITTELAVGAIPELVDAWNISHVFLGFIVLPFVGNAAEHVTAAKMASRNRMVLAKNVAVESATQVVLFITPAIVLFGWFRGRDMTLQFDHFEIGCILLTGIVVTFAICRGDSGWKQGLVLHAIYLTVAVGAVFYRGRS